MQVVDKHLDGLVVFERKVFTDVRGFFEEFVNESKFNEATGRDTHFVQINHSRSHSGVLRGLHYQLEPAQGKFVGVTHGRVWDVAVDIRKGSPTYGHHFGLELSGENGRMLWIPGGFAHGFCVLGDSSADMFYAVDCLYNPKSEGGILWSDSDLKIPWPVSKTPTVAERDLKLPTWKYFKPQ